MIFCRTNCIKKIATNDSVVFLTFDDGPCDFTQQVLDVLLKHNAQATFFVIGQNAERSPQIIERILKENHRIYSHSIDHQYRVYFSSYLLVLNWLLDSLNHLQRLIKKKSLIFRPPAGVITPPLAQACEALGVQIILWNYRFYDSIFKLTKKKITTYLKKAQFGDIILLHDNQKATNQKIFLQSLDYLLTELKKKNIQSSALKF